MLTVPLIALASLVHLAPQVTTWTVGEPAPHIHLPDIRTGEPIDLVAFRGQKILLAEFASW